MTTGYTPLFSSIIHSTIWRESNETRLVWVTMMAMADSRGIVESSIPGLADAARVSIKHVEQALKILSEKDDYSRTKDEDGRRITEVPGGWRLINHRAFRQRARDRAEYMRNYRAEKQAPSAAVKPPKVPRSQADLDDMLKAMPFGPKWQEHPELIDMFGNWMQYRRSQGGRIRDWQKMFEAQVRWLDGFGCEDIKEIVQKSMRNGWTGLFPPSKSGAAQPAQTSAVDPDIDEYARQGYEMYRRGEKMANFLEGLYDKFGAAKKKKIVQRIDMYIHNPEKWEEKGGKP